MKKQWRWIALVLITLAPRLYLLRIYDIELSQDGFDAVTTVAVWHAQGIGALSQPLVTRLVLHPLYMLWLYGLRALVPLSADFFLPARLFSTLCACIAVLTLFAFTRRAFGEVVAWIAALLLAFAPTFLWESVAILSSTLFLALYLAVLFALRESRYRLAALLAFLAAITRLEGVALLALVLIVLFIRDVRARAFPRGDWLFAGAMTLAAPLTFIAGGLLSTGNALEFIGVQSIAELWLRAFAPGDFFSRAGFFLGQYSALVPAPIVWLGITGAAMALWRGRTRDTRLLFLTSALYLIFFETLVWFNYTTLEVRFLMYPGLPLLIFAGVALAFARHIAQKKSRPFANFALGIVVLFLIALSFQQGDAGMRFIYNSYSSQREVVDELERFVPRLQPTNVIVYGGTAGALDYYARPRGLDLNLFYFRFAPEIAPEKFLLEQKIEFVIYPVGNAFAKAKYPYLAQFEMQTRGGVTFQPLTQFATTPDQQLYSLWSVRVAE